MHELFYVRMNPIIDPLSFCSRILAAIIEMFEWWRKNFDEAQLEQSNAVSLFVSPIVVLVVLILLTRDSFVAWTPQRLMKHLANMDKPLQVDWESNKGHKEAYTLN